MKKKSVNLVFLFLLLAVGCSQETVMNGSISGKTNASDTKMSINIMTETSRTVRPAVTKWEITVTNKEEENNLEYSKTVDSKTTSVTFINIVATATYTVEVYGLDEDGNKILSGAKEKVQIEANKVNICNVTVSDDFNTDEFDKNGTLSVNISGLGELGIQENSSFTLKMSGLANSNNYKNVELTYKDGVLSGRGSDILPGSYKISIADFPVNVIQDPIVNIYPGAITEINRTWNGNKNDVKQNNTLKNTLVPVWNKNADGGDSVGLIGANGLFATPTWENGTFVACDTDDAGNLWTLTITETAINEDGSKTNTYKLTNEHAKESYYFQASERQKVIDFCVAEIDLEPLLSDTSNIEESKYNFLMDNFGKTKLKTLFLSLSNKEIYTCFIDKLIKDGDELPLLSDYDDIFSAYMTTHQGGVYISTNLGYFSSIEVVCEKYNDVSGFYLYVAGTYGVESEFSFSDNNGMQQFISIYKFKITSIEILQDNLVPHFNVISSISNDDHNSNGYSFRSPILTLDIGEYFKDYTIEFYNEAFKISDMCIKGNDLYITAGCVSFNKNAYNIFTSDSYEDDYSCYSFGGLFKYNGVLNFYYNNEDYNTNFLNENYKWDNETKKVTSPKIEYVYGVNDKLSEEELSEPLKENSSTFEKTYTLIGLTQAETNDSEYFAGPRYIIPSDDKLFIVDSGFYGEYSESEIIGADGTTTNGVTFTLKDKRNRIFTFDINNNNELSFNSITKIDDSISFDYDYITETEPFESDGYGGTKETVSW